MSAVGRARRLGKLILAGVLDVSGLLEVYRRVRMKESAIVLLYHRVVDDPRALVDISPSGIVVAAEAFDSQMAFLKKHYRMISLIDLVERISRRLPFEGNACCVTFDDGWRDNYTHAFPILMKYGVPCTVFLTTNFIDGTQWFWESRLEHLVAHLVKVHRGGTIAKSDAAVLHEALDRLGCSKMLNMAAPQLRRFLRSLILKLRSSSSDEREATLHALEELLLLPSFLEPREFMTWDEIREMEAAGVDFGSHTMSHANLERCSRQEAAREVSGGRAALERSLARPRPLFAYPFGKNTTAVQGLVAGEGFAGAVTTNPGLVNAGSNPLGLNRIDIQSRVAPNLAAFACRVTNLLGVY